jgi:hypothetical protein
MPRLGQTVTIVVDPPSGRRLSGTVVEIGKMMGRRQILTAEAADKSDRDVRSDRNPERRWHPSYRPPRSSDIQKRSHR